MLGCATVCDCNSPLVNTGIGCSPIMKVEKVTWLINQVNSEGELNYIDLTVDLDDAFFTAMINNADPLARLYPLPPMLDIVDEREKPVVYTYKNGTKRFVRDGVRSFMGMFPPESTSSQLVGILESGRCAKPCKFQLDANGTIWGRLSDDGTKLYPFLMVAGSIAALFTKETDTTPQMIAYSFDYDPSERDCFPRGLQTNSLTGDINPLNYEGLIDVFIKVISCSAAAGGHGELVVQLFDGFGNLLNPELIKGLEVGIFTVYDVTAAADIIDFTMAEGPSGTYTFTFVSGHALTATHTLNLIPSQNGYGFENVASTAIVVGA